MKHQYTTEDLLWYVSGEGSESWRQDLREQMFGDRDLLLEYREVRKWDRFLSKLRFQPSVSSVDTIMDHAKRSMVIALC